jgi:predicted phosphodiesterase
MRIAIVSDIHGNRTALDAVVADLRETSPDLVLHGGDLAHGGACAAETVDRIRDLGWQGVMGNTDEMLFRPESLEEFASRSSNLEGLFAAIGEMATRTRELLGEKRLDWLRSLPCVQTHPPLALVHASPQSVWRAPGPEANDDELESIYSQLGQPFAIYAHIHRSYIRAVSKMTVANTGSVSLSYDGDRRAAYLVLDGTNLEIRRVEYDVDQELKALSRCGLPHAGWIAKILESGLPQMP